jgi:hypothetical protein
VHRRKGSAQLLRALEVSINEEAGFDINCAVVDVPLIVGVYESAPIHDIGAVNAGNSVSICMHDGQSCFLGSMTALRDVCEAMSFQSARR